MGFSQIPLPNTSKWGDFSGILQNIMKNRLTAQAEASLNKYRQGSLDISRGNLAVSQKAEDRAQQAENRAQQLMPYLVQKYKDIHGKAMSDAEMNNLYNSIIKNAYAGTSPQVGTEPTQSAQSAQSTQPSQPGMETPLADQGAAPPSALPPGQDQATGGYTPIGAPPLPMPMPGQMPAPGQAPMQGAPSIQGQPPQARPSTEMPAGASPMGEQVIRPGNPNLSRLDAIAGLPKSPVPAPKITYDKSNGMMYTQYPSGKVTAQKMPGEAGKTKEELEDQRQLNREKLIETRENVKEATKIEHEAAKWRHQANLLKEAKAIIDKNPGQTGIRNLFGQKTKLAKNKKLGSLKDLFGEIQANLGRIASDRGGPQALKWAELVKPTIFDTDETNLGMIEQAMKNSSIEYNDLNERYGDKKKGKKLSNFPVFEDMVSVKDNHTGKITKMTRAEAKKLMEQ